MTDDKWPLEADFTDVMPITKEQRIKVLKKALVNAKLDYSLDRLDGNVIHVNVYIGD
tara:strand:+ start:232 stop:402 length:171 start_codon:yes stop_codon:yes gene_type:complete